MRTWVSVAQIFKSVHQLHLSLLDPITLFRVLDERRFLEKWRAKLKKATYSVVRWLLEGWRASILAG